MDILSRPDHFLDDAPMDDRPEQTVWAKFEHFEQSGQNGTVAVLDGIDADWFDERSPSERGWLTRAGAESGDHVSILAVSGDELEKHQTWYRIVLGPGRVRAPIFAHEIDLHDARVALQYDSLLGLGVPRPLLDLKPATRAEAARLGAAGSLAEYPDADLEDIEQLLGEVCEITSAAVLDVGQGNWNALLCRGVPSLLFDLGGGVGAHLTSFPATFDKFCFEARPLVVLSHWDWDHWSSAVRFPEAQQLTWIVPRQRSLGPTHARFLAALQATGTVLIFPRNKTLHSRSRTVQLQQALGRASSANETGLAMLICNGAQAILFPGDAGYGSLRLPDALTSVVIPHHGGLSRSSKRTLPRSDHASVGRAVLSYAANNHFKHPTRASVNLHRHWAARLLRTADRGPGETPGHVELHWTPPARATPPCCPKSALPLPQR
jgi:hypothetical protein